MRTWFRLLAVCLIAAGSITITAAPAAASCFTTPAVSPYAFVGMVLSVERQGRVAHVKTDDGRTVIVSGTPEGSTEPGQTVITSVDRTYTAGARYEFHPINDTSPYEDNACTATRLLAVGERSSGGVAPEGVPSSGTGVGAGVPAAVASAAMLVLLAVGVVWIARRRARLRSANPHAG